MICLLTAIELSPGGSSTLHIYTQTIHRTTQITTNLEECGPCHVFASSSGICLTTEDKARKNLSQGKKNLNQGKKNLSQFKKNLAMGRSLLASFYIPKYFVAHRSFPNLVFRL
jgi:hypothetical protein